MLPVSVVIPAYRRPEELRRALETVFGQVPDPPAEVIVVDDASGDTTGDVGRELGATVIVHDQNRGEGAARNTGIAAARHEWVALLDSDDAWRPGHLAAIWPLRAGHVLVGGACVAVGDGPPAGRIYGWHGDRPRVLTSPNDVLWPENTITPSGALLHRDTALAAGGFAEGMRRAADLDLWVRLLERGTAVTSPVVGVDYHLHAGQVSADRSAMYDAHEDVARAYAGRPWFDRRLPARLAARHAWDRRDRAALARALARPAGAAGFAQLLRWRRAKRRALTRG